MISVILGKRHVVQCDDAQDLVDLGATLIDLAGRIAASPADDAAMRAELSAALEARDQALRTIRANDAEIQRLRPFEDRENARMAQGIYDAGKRKGKRRK